jgi:hypothetical protein
VRVGQDGTGAHPELIVQPPPQLLEHCQRGSLLPAAGQRDHQAGVRALVQRVTFGQCVQVRQHPVMPAQCRRGLGVLHHQAAQLILQGDHRGVAAQERNIGQRLVLAQASEPGRRGRTIRRGPPPGGRPGARQQPLSLEQVNLDSVPGQPVPITGRLDQPPGR